MSNPHTSKPYWENNWDYKYENISVIWDEIQYHPYSHNISFSALNGWTHQRQMLICHLKFKGAAVLVDFIFSLKFIK